VKFSELAAEVPRSLLFPAPNGGYRQQGKPLGRSDTLKRYLELAGITRRVRWHDLRHTCATNLITGVLGRQWTLAETQRIMGHATSAVTERYSHMSDDVISSAARATVVAGKVEILTVLLLFRREAREDAQQKAIAATCRCGAAERGA